MAAPIFQSVETDVSGSSYVILTYDQPLYSANVPGAGAFTVIVDDTVVSVTGVSVNGQKVYLSLATSLPTSAKVQVSYTAPAVNNESVNNAAIQNEAGEDATSLGLQTVTHTSPSDTIAPVLQSAATSTDGARVILTYNEVLHATVAGTDAFTVIVGDKAVAVIGVWVNGQTVQLALATPVASGQAVKVAYNAPAVDGTAGNAAIQDGSGNDAVSLAVQDVTNSVTNSVADVTAPVFQSAATNTAGTKVILTYNEVLHDTVIGTNAFTVIVNDSVVAVTSVWVNGQTVELMLATPVITGEAVQVSYRAPAVDGSTNNAAIQDRAGNDAVALPVHNVTNSAAPDTTAPVFQSAATSADGAKVILTYSEALHATVALMDAFTVIVNGVVVGVTDVSVVGSTVELTLAIPVITGEAVQVSYRAPTVDGSAANHAIQDEAGNDAVALPVHNVINSAAPDTTAPVFQSAATNEDGTKVILTYNEVLHATGAGPNAFEVKADGVAVTVSNVSVVGSTVELTLAAPLTTWQTMTVAYNAPTVDGTAGNAAIQDRTGNDAATLGAASVTNTSTVSDTTAPVFQSAATSADGTKVILTYNEVLHATVVEDIKDNFEVQVNGSVVAVTEVSVVGQTVELTLATPVTVLQEVTVVYDAPTVDAAVTNETAIQDKAGLDAGSLEATPVTNTSTVPDTTAPVLQSAVTNAAGTKVILTYNEVLHDTVIGTNAFTVIVNDVVVGVTDVSVVGSTVELTLVIPVITGEAVQVSYRAPAVDGSTNNAAIQDRAGNDAVALPVHNVTNSAAPDTTAPVFQSAATSADGAKVILTYSEALHTTVALMDAFTVIVNGVVVGVTDVSIAGSTVELTLAIPVITGEAVQVSYRAPAVDGDAANHAIQDEAGNDAVALPVHNVINSAAPDTTAPVFQSAATNEDGTKVILTYNEVLHATGAGPNAFEVKADGVAVTVSNVSVVGSTVELTLAAPLTTGQTMTVAYNAPTVDATAGNGAIQDRTGNDAATLGAASVTNTSTVSDTTAPVFQSAATSADGTKVILTYNEVLHATVVEAIKDNFEVQVNGSVVTVDQVSVVGQTVELTLATPVTVLQEVTVAYDAPTVDATVDNETAIQDRAGNDAVSLPVRSVTNSTVPDTTAPALQSAVTSTDGTKIVLTYDEVLHDTVAGMSAFEVRANDAIIALSNVSVVGSTVELTLAAPLTTWQTVTVSYTAPEPDGDVTNSAIQDKAGNDAASLVAQTVTNTSTVPDTTAPVFQSAATSVDGTKIILTYDEALHATVVEAIKDNFEVQVNGSVVTVDQVSVVGQTVELTLATPVTVGQEVTVAYDAPTVDATVDNETAIQDRAGNDAVSLPVRSVTNNSTPVEAGADNKHDVITASEGNKTVTLAKNLSDYVLEHNGKHISINEGGAVADHLVGFTKLVFKDGSIDLTSHSGLFDPVFYALNNLDVFKAGVGSSEHFQKFGASEGRDPNAFFDVSGYLAVNKDVAAAGVGALEHFINAGAAEGRDTSANFDVRLYLQNNADVAAAGINALEHYLQFGRAEGRKAYEAIGETIADDGFDAQHYLLSNADIAAAGIDARTHFAEYGFKEGRSANTLFDPAEYLAANADVAAAGIDPLAHYNANGWREGRAASSEFDTNAYLAENADIAAAGINPLTHYLQYGIYEGREIHDVNNV